jgi:hypothetical protein
MLEFWPCVFASASTRPDPLANLGNPVRGCYKRWIVQLLPRCPPLVAPAPSLPTRLGRPGISGRAAGRTTGRAGSSSFPSLPQSLRLDRRPVRELRGILPVDGRRFRCCSVAPQSARTVLAPPQPQAQRHPSPEPLNPRSDPIPLRFPMPVRRRRACRLAQGKVLLCSPPMAICSPSRRRGVSGFAAWSA